MILIWPVLDKIIAGIDIKKDEIVYIEDDYAYPLTAAMIKFKEGKQKWTSK